MSGLHTGFIQRYIATGQPHVLDKMGREMLALSKVPLAFSVTHSRQGEYID